MLPLRSVVDPDAVPIAATHQADEYLASAEDNLAGERHTPAAGDAIHAGISCKDTIVTALTGSTSKGKDHATAAKELKQALGKRPEAATAEDAPRPALREGRCGIRRRAGNGCQGRVTRPAGPDAP